MPSVNMEQWRFLKDIALLIHYIEDCGYIATGGELKRTIEQQRIHMNAGRSNTINSKHLLSLGADVRVRIEGKFSWDYSPEECLARWKHIGMYWEGLSPQNVWGGHFESLFDPDHFERDPKKGKV